MSDAPDNSQLDSMSDDDFMKVSTTTVSEIPAENPSLPGSENTPEGGDEPVNQEPVVPEQEQPDPGEDDDDDDLDLSKKPDGELEKPADKKPVEKPADAADADKSKAEGDAPVQIDYKDAYEKFMAPFKANGKTIQMKTPEEAVSLMQKGANYLQKMTALKPGLKILRMLENNQLLDESKLGFLIDLDKKDPAAIAKFMKDKQIEPLDLDLSETPDYKPGKHTVSDKEMAFTTTLQEVRSSEHGAETIQMVEREWDAESQRRVFAEPSILKLMTSHRSNGLYDQITSEMERRKLLGTIRDGLPFLDAYKNVGDELHEHGQLLINGVPTNQKKQAPQAQAASANPTTPNGQRQPIESRTPARKPGAVNNPAAVAAPRSTSGKSTKQAFNPLTVSDEEFDKLSEENFRL